MCGPCWIPMSRSAQRCSRSPRPAGAFDLVLEYGTSLISIDTLAELAEVLGRSRFNRYQREERRLEFLATLARQSELVDVTAVVAVCRDPKDDKFLELALSGRATHVISGDNDLLSLNPFRGIAILTPQQFVMELTSLA